jgi:hypothetical protein
VCPFSVCAARRTIQEPCEHQGTRPVTDVKSRGNNAVVIPDSRVGTTDSLCRSKVRPFPKTREKQYEGVRDYFFRPARQLAMTVISLPLCSGRELMMNFCSSAETSKG